MPINYFDYQEWLSKRYAKSYIPTILCYNRKYGHLMNGNLRELDKLSLSVKNNTIKSLIILSKYLQIHEPFAKQLKQNNVKVTSPDSFSSFIRIFNSNDHNTIGWINQANTVLKDNERLYLRFLLNTGMRKAEAILSFNLIIKLHSESRLNEYYDYNLNILQHFKFPKLFCRRTKNVFISFIPLELVNAICNSETVSYQSIIKRLRRGHINCRINEIRDLFATSMLQHGLSELETNMIQGRIGKDLLMKSYFSPKLKELGNRVFKALSEIENIQ